MSSLFRETPPFLPALVIFDKDGTLIDFDYMWANWVTQLGQRLERATPFAKTERLYRAMGYDADKHTVRAGSPLAAHSMAELGDLTTRVLESEGMTRAAAEDVMNATWFVPDPVAMARPLADLPRLFEGLHARSILTAIATSDDRAATLETLRGLGIAKCINALVSADDGLPNKPAPDMLLRICRELNVLPERAVMVGDGAADLRAAKAAGITHRVGVLTGVSSRLELQPYTDVIVEALEGFAARL